MELEITSIPPLADEERSLVDCHSAINAANVVRAELEELGRLLNDPALLVSALQRCERLQRDFHDRQTAVADAAQLDDDEHAIDAVIAAALARRPALRDRADVLETIANVHSALWILRVRLRELVARTAAPAAWTTYAIQELEADFQEFFAALERHARGRYRFATNLACQRPGDYYLDFKLEGTAGRKVTIPAVLKDVLRDLIANARKYTAPGGQIRAALHASPDGIRLVVQDTGRGIPADELRAVVAFGRRGSNVADVRTLGGGFGLTKAFLVAQRFGGRFWIGSEEGRGTTVRIWLPAPPGVSSSGLNALDT